MKPMAWAAAMVGLLIIVERIHGDSPQTPTTTNLAEPIASPDGEGTGSGADSAERSAAIPPAVDLRPQFASFDLTPRRQGKRNTCSVFTTTAALEFALSRHLGEGTQLSVEYLNWACNQVTRHKPVDRGQFFHDLLKGFDQHGICLEAEMPYAKTFSADYAPSHRAIDEAQQISATPFTIHWINPWKKTQGLSESQLHEIKVVLASGWPVAAGSNHSRLLVGYTDDANQPGGGSFITKDSGKGKYSTVTYEFAKSKIGDVFWIEAPLKPAK
jgi:hypothetical protein